MRVPARDAITRDGRGFRIRSAAPGDVGAILDHLLEIHELDADVGLPEPHESPPDAGAIARRVERLGRDEGSVFLIAEAGGIVVGSLALERSRLEKVRHNAQLAMSVRRGWRRARVGTALLGRALALAAESRVLARVTLRAFASNAPALALYERHGFRVEGRLRGQVRVRERFVDELWMARGV